MFVRTFAFGSPSAIPVPCFLPTFLVAGKRAMTFSLGANTTSLKLLPKKSLVIGKLNCL